MNQEKIWAYFQNNAQESFVGNYSRLEFIAKTIRSHETCILNVGVGNGFLEELLLKSGHSVFSLDPDHETIRKINERNSHLRFQAKAGYSTDIPFANGTFDVVVMSEVLEHLTKEDILKTLNEVSRVLKGGGRFVGTVPADEDLSLNESACPKCGEVFHRWGHLQSFSHEGLKQSLLTSFQTVSVRRVYFGSYRLSNWKGKLGWWLKKILCGLGVRGQNENYVFCCS